ncbi:hypothetical protein SLEP1_g44125 [Rubroshorea leprosula]|uniref:Integrase catalytic domain-containing protein n=1 Tax=Rubroshorea leprosula TaxID=152421 RepID=A0AAV5LFK2_9ROSI|nr:hypothetical protein SLEP1_g44125 [Rubroshorea leprosula]
MALQVHLKWRRGLNRDFEFGAITLGQAQYPNNLLPQIPNPFPSIEYAEGRDENQPHNLAHNSALIPNQGDLLARNNPGDPLINLLNPTQQPPVQQQDPQPVQHALALTESQVEQRGASPPHHNTDSIPHPLNTNITLEPYPTGFKIPQLKTYDGTKDPDDHLYAFYSYMQAQNAPDALMCKIFPSTLCGLDPALLQRYDSPIYGFNDQPILVEGVLTLNVAFGSDRTYVTPSVWFLVVKMASAFNAVIGRPTLTEIRAVVTQSHFCIKFPTPMRIATLRGNQEVARHCYITSVTRPQKGKDQTSKILPQQLHDNQQVMRVEIIDNRPEDETRATPIDRNLEVYVNDIVVKSLKTKDHLADLDETFNNLKKNRMWLNPAKCIFSVEFGKFLGFMVSERGIEVNREKIKAIVEMESPKSVKDIQRLTRRVAALRRFISKSANKCMPFFKIMRSTAQKDEFGKQKKFEWNPECQAAFDELKSYLSSPPLLTKATDGEILYLYLSISDEAISSMLVREERKQQKSVYYISSVLHETELRYPIVEKAALVVVISRSIIRAQALIDFIVECTPCHPNSNPKLSNWILYVDGASSSKSSGAGAFLVGPDGYRSEHALKFNFDATNNMAEYEALLLGLQLALELKVTAIQVYNDSQLVVNQVNSVCEVVDSVMMKQIHFLSLPLIAPYALADYALREVHEAVCGSHIDARTLAHKVLRQGYYWPNLYKDTTHFVHRCPKCQLFAHLTHQPAKELTNLVAPWPFAQWGLDLLGPFMKGVGGVTHLIIGVNYFTKWVEARPLSNLTSKRVEDFVFSSIICWYGIPNQIVADNGTQFNCSAFRDFCSSYGIKVQFTSVYHPESNGMVEYVNKAILDGIKLRLEQHKARWADELNNVLWAYRTTSRTTTGETLYHLTFGTKASIPIEIRVLSFRVTHFDQGRNGQLLRENLDLLDEVREEARLRTLVYKQKLANFYNKRVHPRTFKVGDLVLRKVGLTGFETHFGKLAPNLEGPYTVAKVPHLGASSWCLYPPRQ